MENKEIEIARSFSLKPRLNGYPIGDVFCSAKKTTTEEEMKSTSDLLYKFCKATVIKEVRDFEKQLSEVMGDQIQMAVESVIAKPELSVEEYEACGNVEKAFRGVINRGLGRVKYAERNKEDEGYANHLESIKNE